MRLSGLIPLAVVLALSAVMIAVADAHGWSDKATQWALVGIIGGTTVADLLLTDVRELRRDRGGERRGRPGSPRRDRGTT